MKYSHKFANYPIDFKSFVVSPTKICLQFSKVQVKLRSAREYRHLLPERGQHSDKYVPVIEQGIELDEIAVGCQLPIVEKYQFALIEAYKHYMNLHHLTYRETYKKEFIDFLKEIYAELGHLINGK